MAFVANQSTARFMTFSKGTNKPWQASSLQKSASTCPAVGKYPFRLNVDHLVLSKCFLLSR